MFRKDWKLKKNPYYVLILTLIVIVGIFLIDKITKGELRLKPKYPFKKYTNLKKITLVVKNNMYSIKNKKIINKFKNIKCYPTGKEFNFNKKNKLILNNDTYYIGIIRGLFDITLFSHKENIFSYSNNIFKTLEVQKQIEKLQQNN